MSWPKRDGIYSFLRHLGPFGCIKTAIFSENANLSKTRFQEKNYTIVSTDHLVQFLNGFAIFHTCQGTHEVWKIAKKPNHIVKFGCGNDCVFFSKNRIFLVLPQQNFAIELAFLAIFHTSWVPWGVWKIAKPFKNCTWWSVEAWHYFFSRNLIFDKLAFSLNIAVLVHPNGPKCLRNE